MKSSGMVILPLAIFYNCKMWHTAIENCIYPFLRSTSFISGYAISLCTNRGDHIRLTLMTDNEQALMLAQKADLYFKQFLSNYPSINKKDNIDGSFFLDFKNNSIHYGVYDYTITKKPYNLYNAYVQDVSEVLIKVFQCYKQDTLSCLTEIMIQFYCIFCNTLFPNNDEGSNLFGILLDQEYKKYSKIELSRILKDNRENFISNEKPLLNILLEKKASDTNRYDEKWKICWESVVLKSNKSLEAAYPNRKISLNNYIHLIHLLHSVFDFEDQITSLYLFENTLRRVNLTR